MYGIGDLGPSAYHFADFLYETKQSYWQILPLNPVDPFTTYSPYSTRSSFGSNKLVISPELLQRDGLIDNAKSISHDENPFAVSFSKSNKIKTEILDEAYVNVSQDKKECQKFYHFCNEQKYWLDDHALFEALSRKFKQPWSKWPEELRDRKPDAIDTIRDTLAFDIEKEKFVQYVFSLQWKSLKSYCNLKGIQIIGDLPMFVSYDSADVWANRTLFKLNSSLEPSYFAGVPPDRFCSDGQLWHNPVYNWDALKATNYEWWIKRFRRTFDLYDIARVDHFRGLVAYWEIPSDHLNAIHGKWMNVPVSDFFNTVFRHFYHLPVIAEDLGTITPDVHLTMRILGFPGTKVLLFAFDNDDPMHPYRPHVFTKHCMACTGNHDTNTVRGWFEHDASEGDKKRLFTYFGEEFGAEDVAWKMIQLLMMSPADMVLFPMQDILNLGKEARMNIPGTKDNNWRWRFTWEQIDENMKNRLATMSRIYGRA